MQSSWRRKEIKQKHIADAATLTVEQQMAKTQGTSGELAISFQTIIHGKWCGYFSIIF